MTDNTVLRLHGIGVTPYSARGLSQTLKPIAAAGQVLRTVDGTLVDFSATQFRKYESVITGSDQQPPAFDGVWQGLLVTVECIATLAFDHGTGGPGRSEVPGSIKVANGHVFYRPILVMRVIDFDISFDEYQAQIGWTLRLEEI